jgi:2-polyprenyl-6-methoxyphenol hydroxylase-like FAD-dependent oxidoreductase
MSESHVAIIGAGPAGLTLARLLQLQGLRFTVYEKDSSRFTRTQGGSLDLHPESGQRAMQAAGLMDRFNAVARYQGQDFKVLDQHGKVHIAHVTSTEEKNRPEIDRVVLRDMLLDAVDGDNVRWDHKLQQVSGPGEDGQYELKFVGKEEIQKASFLVGADGAWSVVRELLSDTPVTYSTCTMVEVRFSDVDVKQPSIGQLVGRGSLGAYGHDRALMAQRNSDGSIRVYILLRVPETWVADCGINFSSPEDVRRGLLTYFDAWDKSLKDLIFRCDDEGIIPRPMYALPVGHTWPTNANVTLLGDAAHLMTPFAGQGVNLAMLDALVLSEALSKHKDDKPAAIKEYETEMAEKVKFSAHHSANNLELMLEENAPQGWVELVRKYMPDL